MMKSGRCHQAGVAESSFHLSMKAMVRSELEYELYSVVEEPPFPPGGRLWWLGYRPDLVGYRGKEVEEEVVLVECETHPNMTRFGAKNHSSVWFQSRLSSPGSVRRILAVPQGKLGAVDLRIRDGWEVWVLGNGGPVQKIPAFRRHSSH